MRFLYKLFVLCILLISSVDAFAQITTTTTGNITTFTAGNNTKSITLHANTTNAAAYQWYKNGVAISGALSQTYIATANGFYTLVAFTTEGCPSPQSDSVSVVFSNPVTPPDTTVTPPPVTPPPVTPPDTTVTPPPVTTPPDTTVTPPPVVIPPPVTTPVIDSVDLTASIMSSNTQAALGDSYGYVITAGNNSSVDGKNVQITYIIPANLTYVSESTAYGTAIYNDSTKTVIWTIPDLEKNSSVNLTVNVKVAQAGLSISSVVIAGSQFDPNMQNNTSTIEQQVNSLVVPNVFTPNGDGVNDAFVVPGLENFSENQLSVMNRWGSEVYVRKNYKNDWTGQGLVEGTYFYILKTKTTSGDWEIYKGYITLLRSHL
jgi:gliding motility-associated-like protein/uncharacterized repeat protein (TIGR01451 family)